MRPLLLTISTTTVGTAAQLGLLALLALGYAKRAYTLGRRGEPVPGWRQACFYGGVIVVCAALTSLSGGGGELLMMHMAEHLLLGDIAALLIVLGLTVSLLEPILRVPLLERLSVLANPLIAFPLWAIDFYAWHLAIFYEAALRHTSVHAIQHVMLLGFGINMWMCLFGPLPTPRWFGNSAKLLYIVAVRFAAVLLGNIFLWSGTLFYPAYIHGDLAWHISPIADQNIAGAVILIEQCVLTVALLWWLFLHTTRHGADRRRDLLVSRGRLG